MRQGLKKIKSDLSLVENDIEKPLGKRLKYQLDSSVPNLSNCMSVDCDTCSHTKHRRESNGFEEMLS